jgi:assimilatory nitrate reductase catalytic subunit
VRLFPVGRGHIMAAIASGARTPAAIGAATRAGTNCASCLPELQRLAASACARKTAPG